MFQRYKDQGQTGGLIAHDKVTKRVFDPNEGLDSTNLQISSWLDAIYRYKQIPNTTSIPENALIVKLIAGMPTALKEHLMLNKPVDAKLEDVVKFSQKYIG